MTIAKITVYDRGKNGEQMKVDKSCWLKLLGELKKKPRDFSMQYQFPLKLKKVRGP